MGLRWAVALGAAVVASTGDGLAQSPAQLPTRVVELSHLFDGVDDATVVVLTADPRTVIRFRPERAARRFPPASTFKIPNTVIALETGVASGPDFPIPWDSVRNPRTGFFPGSWARDQTLRSAFRSSVVWYYQEIARQIGARRMREWLRRLDYGNASIAGGIDRFWLDGGLRISADEQVSFLRRILAGEPDTDVSAPTRASLRDVALLETGTGWRLFGKTGTSEVTATRENGWIVGWLEQDGGTAYYAINMEGEEVWERWRPERRTRLALQVLREVGVLGAAGAEP